MNPPKPCNRNIFELTEQERREQGIDTLPSSLQEALEALAADDLVKDTLGPHILDRYLDAKNHEWKEYMSKVHQWELDQYLTVY